MNKTKKAVSLLVATALTGSIFAGCSNSKDGAAGATTSPSDGQATPKQNEERVKLKMFYNIAGMPMPTSINLSDNPVIKIVEDLANVDLEFDVPPYNEYVTKHNLLLASGQLPDIVHSTVPDGAMAAARDGAFIDLKKYYDNSPALQKVVTPQMMELAKDPVSGKYFRIPMAYDKGPQGEGLMVRYDLVQKYNGGKYPASVEEWIELMRKVKKEDPSSIPMSFRVAGDNMFYYGGGVIFGMYGALPYGYRIDQGKIIPNVSTPEFKEAVKVLKGLYDEGILDPEFAVTDSAKWFPKLSDKNVVMQWNSADQILNYQIQMTSEKATPAQRTQVWSIAPPLTKYPDVLKDRKYAITGLGAPITAHGLYISSKTKDPDRAFRVIEAFANEKLKDAIFWGNEGETYTVKDGKRAANPAKMSAEDHIWKRQYAFVFGYTDGQDAQSANYEAQLSKEVYTQLSNDVKTIGKAAGEIGLDKMPGYTDPEDVQKKNAEIMQAINKFTTEAIMGRITMEQLDAEIGKWETKYRSFKYDPMQKFLDANKEQLLKNGFKKAGW